MGSPRILYVGRAKRNAELMLDLLRNEGYAAAAATSLGTAEAQLNSGEELPALALLDLSGFDATVWSLCDFLRSRDVPFLLLSSRVGPALRQHSRRRGAEEVLEKPLPMRELLALISKMTRA